MHSKAKENGCCKQMMELSQEDIELIDRFNNGELSKVELALFNERMNNAGFASSVSLHNHAIEIIHGDGRDELRSVFASIQSKLATTRGFEKYTPGKPKNGGGIWSWIIGSIIFVAIVSYFFLTGKIKPGEIKDLLRENEVDTVYHYIYHMDTIIKSRTDTVSGFQTDTLLQSKPQGPPNKSIRKIIQIDTVYQFPKSEHNNDLH